jgi:propionyl-CoA carboxylase alpha chain
MADGTIVRNDTGVFEGGEISMYYDPMIAKLCTWGRIGSPPSTPWAKRSTHFEVEGIGHNLPFLSAVMDHPRFRDGRLTTAFIAEEYPGRFAGCRAGRRRARQLATVAAFKSSRP